MSAKSTGTLSIPPDLDSIAEVNSAWIITGLAARYAFALGLHVRNKDPEITEVSREMTIRIWWSVYSLKRQLCVITGRPSAIRDDSCSTTLPIPFDEKTMSGKKGEEFIQQWNRGHSSSEGRPSETASQDRLLNRDSGKQSYSQPDPNIGLYFRLRVQLGIISQEAMVQLFAAGTVTKSWEHVQGNITRLGKRLDEWLANLPTQFDFTKQQDDTLYLQQRLALGFFSQL